MKKRKNKLITFSRPSTHLQDAWSLILVIVLCHSAYTSWTLFYVMHHPVTSPCYAGIFILILYWCISKYFLLLINKIFLLSYEQPIWNICILKLIKIILAKWGDRMSALSIDLSKDNRKCVTSNTFQWLNSWSKI